MGYNLAPYIPIT